MKRLANLSEKQIFRIIGIFGFVVALIIQGIRGFQYVILQHDGRNDYVTQAKEMVLGWNYMLENPNLLGHGMGFSFLIAFIFKITNSESFLLLKVIFAILHGLSAFLIAKLGFTLGLKRKYWVLATIFFVVDPFVLIAVSDVTTEPLVTFFVLYWAYLYVCIDSYKCIKRFHLPFFTLTCFYSVIARPNSLLPVLGLSLLIFVKWKNLRLPRQKMFLAASFFLLLMSAYHFILYKLYKGFVFLTPVGGYNAEVMCSKEFVPQYIGLISKSENSRINDWVYGITKGPEILASQTSLDVSQLNRELWQIGITKCLDNPIESFFVLALKPLALWRPYVVFGAYSPWVFLASLLLWVPLLTAAIYFLTRRDLGVAEKQLRLYFFVMAAAFTVSLELTPTQIRHRVAFAEPFFWIFFFWALGKFDSWRAQTKQRVPNSAGLK